MAILLTAIATLFNGSRNMHPRQERKAAAVRLAISSKYSAESFAAILSRYMEGGAND